MNTQINKNEHYVTKSFVKNRFGKNGLVQTYDVKSESWKLNASPRFVFATSGYTQLLIEGEPPDNTLEETFSKAENHLKSIFPELDAAATAIVTKVPEELYKNLCVYCAYLWYLSPFAKAKAPADYVKQLDMDLQHGNVKQLQQIGMLESDIVEMQRLHSAGYKFILAGDNYQQCVFRIQLQRSVLFKAKMFRENVKWTVYNSSLELPISDIALIDFPEDDKSRLYILPISPNRVLIGRIELGSPPSFYKDPLIYGRNLTDESAANVLDLICLSAVKTIACRNKFDVSACRKRAIQKKMGFTQIKEIDAVLSAGMKIFDPDKDLRHIPVSDDAFTKYILSFIGPPNQN